MFKAEDAKEYCRRNDADAVRENRDLWQATAYKWAYETEKQRDQAIKNRDDAMKGYAQAREDVKALRERLDMERKNSDRYSELLDVEKKKLNECVEATREVYNQVHLDAAKLGAPPNRSVLDDVKWMTSVVVAHEKRARSCDSCEADATEMAKSITNLRNQNVDAYREIGRSHAVLTALGVPSQRSEFGEPEGPRNLSVYERIEKFAEYMETKKGNGTIPICTCKHCAEARAIQTARDSYIPPAEGPQ